MMKPELIEVIKKVITSWQVIAATVVLILYFMLVSYVARFYQPRSSSFGSTPKQKGEPAEVLPESGEDEDLDIEEE
jgi:hypothetical protein